MKRKTINEALRSNVESIADLTIELTACKNTERSRFIHETITQLREDCLLLRGALWIMTKPA